MGLGCGLGDDLMDPVPSGRDTPVAHTSRADANCHRPVRVLSAPSSHCGFFFSALFSFKARVAKPSPALAPGQGRSLYSIWNSSVRKRHPFFLIYLDGVDSRNLLLNSLASKPIMPLLFCSSNCPRVVLWSLPRRSLCSAGSFPPPLRARLCTTHSKLTLYPSCPAPESAISPGSPGSFY